MFHKLSLTFLSLTFALFAYSKPFLPVDTSAPATKIYKDVITNQAITKRGLLTIHQVKDKWFAEIPLSILGKELLTVSRIERGPSSLPIYAGDFISNTVIVLEKAPGNKLFFRKKLYTVFAGDSTASMYNAVVRSNLMPVIASFPIATKNDTTGAVVVDITDYILGENELFSFNGSQKKQANLTGVEPDKSYIENIACFGNNIEINTVKTFGYSRNAGDETVNSHTTFGLNTSIILLPEKPMTQRLQDIRVGYFPLMETDFSRNTQGVKTRSYVRRWRLEPRPGDIAKYMKGEMVEPQKPIVFYIDPATPAKWIPYLKQGVEDWNEAFVQAGFSHAIMAKEAPSAAQDPSWSLYDAAHSAIIYKPSDIENASGPTVVDPRSGEILESHINWYHNMLQLLHDQYFINCSAADINAQRMVFPDSLMGKLIRMAIAHEVGHTLGLLHNMGGSASAPVDSLRSKQWLSANSMTASIMDYSRFNYVAQPTDGIPEEGLIAKIGAYDKWAIEWGYRYFPEYTTADEAAPALRKWVSGKMADKRLWWGSEHSFDPRAQTGDAGDDVFAATRYGILNLQYILKHLEAWTYREGESYEEMSGLYINLQNQFINYMGHVGTYLGGSYEDVKFAGQTGSVYDLVPAATQRKALHYIIDQVAMAPSWLVDTSVLLKTGQTGMGVIGLLNGEVIDKLVGNPYTMYFIESRNESVFGKQAYSIVDYMYDLKKLVWSELYSGKTISLYRRGLQERYLKYTISYLSDERRALRTIIYLPISGFTELFPADAIEMLRGQLLEIRDQAKKILTLSNDVATRYHLQYVIDQVNRLQK